MNLPPLILASASPRRAQLLRQLELDFRILPTAVPEAESEFLSPRELCQLNAYRKTRCVAKQHPDALVLGADTVVCLGHRVFGKPPDLAAARSTLAQLQGKIHIVITGVCLLHLRRHRQRLFSVSTRVTFRAMKAAQIERYLHKVNPLDKAGAYAIQEHGDLLVKTIKGSFSNVVGLPLERLNRELRFFKLHR
jgi:septum formation protein